ncbi:sterol desaturase family protein [Spirosoma taeanense]|uniref:Sterol desaturase family protein n=1 Tax=Spirosoma taeanense TaxID=2735870 RepID=A0A6M5Y437_9BACT|nr:sterol desaturase family protein [Spirosoma taeanense]QJW88164.1 sterol desaturase family protein [Spirosoma taeanense]
MRWFPIPPFDFVIFLLMVLAFGLLMWIQWRAPLRRQRFNTVRRVVRNIGVSIPMFICFRLLLVPLPLLTAIWAGQHQLGLLRWLLPAGEVWRWVQAGLGFLLFDYSYYWWHQATHYWPAFYRFHNIHHTDLDMDVSTAVRFHFLDMIVGTVFRSLIVLGFGIGFWTALVYEGVFELATQFHHSNTRLPKRVEQWLNYLVVTPRMHGIHHSIVRDEFNSNWGTVLSIWDRLHGTHRMDIPQSAVDIGVPAYRDERELTFSQLLKMPFGPQRDWQLPSGERPETRN